MTGFLTGAEGLDQVFLRLAENWDSLDVLTKRYIATTAAGSRQQSRFIAMMQDYARTQELVAAAHNATGASQEQFEKTLDSLDSKLQQLQNSWNEFTMNLANDALIKSGVDLLDGMLTTVNGLTSSFGDFGGAVTKVGLAFGVLKGGYSTIKKLWEYYRKMLTKPESGGPSPLRSGMGLLRGKGKFGFNDINEMSIFAGKRLFSTTDSFKDTLKNNYKIDDEIAEKIGLTSRSIVSQRAKGSKYNYKNDQANINKQLANTEEQYQVKFNKNGEATITSATQRVQKLEAGLVSAAAAGMGLSLAFSAFGKAAKSAGNEELAESFEKLSAGIGMVSTSIMVLMPLLTKIGMTNLYILGVMAVVAAIGVLVYAFVDFRSELEKAEDAAEKSAEEAKKTKEAYEDLANSSQELDSLKEKFKELKTGTEEWRNTIEEVNEKVLEMVKANPTLTFSIDKNGMYVLDNYDEVLKQKKEEQRTAATQSYVDDINLNRERIKNIQKGMSFNTTSINRNRQLEDGNTVGDKLIQEKVYENIRSKNTKQEAIDYIKDIEFLTEEEKDSFIALNQEYLNQLDKFNGGILNSAKALLSLNMDENLLKNDFANEIINAFAKEVASGADYKTVAQAAEKFINNLTNNISSGIERRSIAAALSGASGEMDRATALTLSRLDNEGIQSVYQVDETQAATMLETAENALQERINKHVQNRKANSGSEDYDALRELRLNKNLDLLDNTAYEKFLNNMGLIAANTEGADVYSEIQNEFLGLISGLDEEAKAKVLEAAGNYEIYTEEGFKAFADECEAAGVDASEFGDILEKTGNIFKKIDLQKIMDSTKELLDLSDDIADRDSSEGIDLDEYEKLFKSNSIDGLLDKFTFDGQKFTFDGPMEDLAEAVRENTIATLKDTIARLEQAQRDAKTFQNLMANEEKWKGNLTDEQIASIKNGTADVSDPQVLAALRDMLGMNENAYSAMEVQQAYGEGYRNTEMAAENDAYIKDLKTRADQALAVNASGSEIIGHQTGTEVLNTEQQLDVKGTSLGITQKDYDKTAESAAHFGDEIKNNQNFLKALTITMKQNAKETVALCKKIEDVKDEFEAGAKAIKNGATASEEYMEAVRKIQGAGNDVFGEEFDEDFITENSGLISKLISDDKEESAKAFEEILNLISEKAKPKFDALINDFFEEGLIEGENTATDIQNALSDIQAEFLLTGNADFSRLFEMMNLSYEQASELADILGSVIGADITIIPKYSYVDLRGNSFESAKATYPGAELVGGRGIRYISGWSAIGTQKSNPYNSGFTPKGSKGGGGGSAPKNWENPYDKLYNLTEKINEAIRQREKLERVYNRLLESRGTTYEQLAKNQDDQLAALREEIRMQEQLQASRNAQLDNIANETYYDSEGNKKTFAQAGVTQYARYDKNTGVVIIDWNAIDQNKDEEKGAAIEAYISRLEELSSEAEEIDKTLEELYDSVEEIRKNGMQEYLSFEQQVYDAIIKREEEIIENEESLNQTIEDNNNKILESLRESIELERQIRDNTKTEEDIADKEARLTYLRRDTSGANALEIKQLEEELANDRESYTDTLIDQHLDRLDKQNQEAAEQRQKQIEMMNAQLEYLQETGYYWPEVYSLLEEAFKSDGSMNQAAQLWDLLKDSEGYAGMSKFGQMNWQKEIAAGILAAQMGYDNWKLYEAEENGSVTLGDGTQLTYKNGKWYDSNGNEYQDLDYDSKTDRYTAKKIEQPSTGGSSSTTTPEQPQQTYDVYTVVAGDNLSKIRDKYNRQGYNTSVDKIYNDNRGVIGSNPNLIYPNQKLIIKKYKTGGIADFTGPAWLDGTKSRPEIVLNARDTQNFLALKDILRGMFNSGKSSIQKGGDNYFDIHISVDEISDDYSVDEMIEKIKSEIARDASYRNVNVIGFTR